MKNRKLVLFLLKLTITIIGIVLIISFSNAFVEVAAKGGGINFSYFLYIVLTLFVSFILSPILLNLIFRNTTENSLSLALVKLLGLRSTRIAKDILVTSNRSNSEVNTASNTSIDDRIVEYFTHTRNINDIKQKKTKLNYSVATLVSDIEGIMYDVPNLIGEAKEFEHGSYSNKLFTSSSSKNGVKVTYISKHKVEVSTGYITVTAPLRICRNFNDFNTLCPYLRYYLKPKKYTL